MSKRKCKSRQVVSASRATSRFRRLAARRITVALAVAAVQTLQFAPVTQAAVYYWDNLAGPAAGFGTAGGTWAAPTPGPVPGWNIDSTGAATPGSVTTLTTDTLNFGSLTNGLAAGTITVTGTVASGDMTFASLSGAIVLSGGTITLAAAETTTVNNATDTISSILAGAATSFTKAGTGILVLTGAETYTGTTFVTGGTLSIGAGGSIAAGSAINVSAGATITTAVYNGYGGAGPGNAAWTIAGTMTVTGGASAEALPTSVTLNNGTMSGASFATFGTYFNTAQTATFTANGTTNTISAGNIGMQSGGTLAFSTPLAGDALTVSSQLGGTSAFAGAVSKTGLGTVTLSGAGIYTGGTTLTAGTLIAKNATALGTSASALKLNGGTLDIQTLTTAYPTTVGGNTTILADNAASGAGTTKTLGTLSIGAFTLNVGPGTNATGSTAGITFGATTISGTSSAVTFSPALNSTLTLGTVTGTTPTITMSGAGNLVFSGTLSTVTALTISNGSVTMNTNNSVGNGIQALTVNSPGILNFNNGQIFGVLNGNGTINENTNALYTNSATSGTFSGTINGTGGYNKQGTGTETLSGANTFSGATAITTATGVLKLANVNAIQNSSSVSVASGTTLQFSVGGTYVTAGTISIAGTGGTVAANSGALWFGQGGSFGSVVNAPINLTAAAKISSYGNTMNQTLGGVISGGVAAGSTALTIQSQGGGTDVHSWTIGSTGNASTYTGNTIFTDSGGIASNTLKLGVTNALPIATTLTLSPSGAAAITKFDLNGQSQQLAGLLNTGTATSAIVLNSGAGTPTLTINNSGTNAFTGVLGAGGTSFALTKTGAGALTLSGATTYSGGTTVNAGALNIAGTLAATGAITVASTGYLNLISNAANPINTSGALVLGTLGSTAVIGLDLGTASDSLTGAAAATTAGNVAFNINPVTGFGANTYTLLSDSAGGLDSATYSLGSVPGGFTYQLNTSSNLVTLTVTAGAAAPTNFYWAAGSSSWATATNWASNLAGTTPAGAVPGQGASVFFSAANATGPTLTTTLDATYTIDSLTFNGNPSGVTAITINPGNNAYNSLTLSPASSASGITVGANNGVITIAAPVVLGASQAWTVDGTTGTATSSLVVSNAITGPSTSAIAFNAGNVNSATVTLSGVNTYSGASTVGANMNVVGGAAGSFSANTSWTVNGTLSTGAFAQTTGSLAGGSGIVQNGSATNAVLTIGNDNLANATFAGTIQNGSTGTLGITKTGTGVQVLSGTNTYTGATLVNNGTLKAGSISALGGGGSALTVTSPGTLDLGGFNNTVASIAASSGTITDSSPAGSGGILKINASSATAITGLITGSVGIQYGNNNGSNAFSSNAANTYSGGTYLGVGTNSARFAPGATTVGNGVGGSLTSGIFGTGPIYIGRATTDQGQIYLAGVATINNPITFNSILGTDVVGGVRSDTAGTLSTLAGVQTAGLSAISYGSYTAATLNVTGQLTGSGTFTGTITGNTGGNLGGGIVIGTNAGLIVGANNHGVGTVVLNNTGTANNYTGDTYITAFGILQTNAPNQLPSGLGKGDVYLNGTFNMQANNQAIGGLSGAGTLDGVSGTPTLDIGGNNSTGLTFTGVIKNTLGTLTLTKSGTGTQTLSGLNTFTGDVTVNGGFIAFASSPGSSGALGNSSNVNLKGGGISYTATGSNALNRSVAIGAGNGTINVANAGGTLTVGSLTSTGGNLVKTGPGLLSLTSATTLNGGAAGVVVSGGTLQGGFGTAGIGSINIAAGGTLSFQNSAANVLTLGGAGSLALANGSALTLELGASGTNDSILYTTASTTGTITLNFLGLSGFGAGTYNLLNLNTGSTNQLTGTNFALGSAPLGYNYTINNDGTLVSLTTSAYTPIYWSGGADNSWATAANFTDQPGTTPAGHTPAPTETVIFNAANAVGPTITTNLDGSRIIDSLQFNGAGTPATTLVTIAQGTGGTLTLKPASASGGIAILTGGGNATISAPVVLDNTLSASQTWSVVDAGSTLTLSGNVTFGANVNKTGAGTLTLSGSNSGLGNLTLSAGTLNLNSAGALGSGALSIAVSTTLNNTFGSAVSLTGNGAVNINGDFTFTGSNSLAFGSGAVTLANNPTINTTANVLTLGGNVSGTGFTKAGAGALTLNGSTSGGGGVNLNAGTLNIGNLAAISGALTIAGGTFDNTTGSAGTLTGVTSTTINGSFTFTGTNSLNLGTGAVTLGTTPTITTTGAATTLTVGGAIGSTANGITKAGAGTLTLSNTNSYTGATSVTAGTLSLTGSLTGSTAISTSGTGVFSQSSTGVISGGSASFTQGSTGTSVLAGTNTYTGNTTVNGGVLTISSTGSLTGNGTTTTGSVLAFGGTAANTVVNIAGNITNYYTFTGATVSGANAVYNQTGGTVNFTTTAAANATNVLQAGANTGYGYMNITGGTTIVKGRFQPSGGGTGVIYIGGTNAVLDHTGGEWFLMSYGPNTGATSSVTVGPGGSLLHAGASNNFGLNMDVINSYAVLNVAGGLVTTSTHAITFGNGASASKTGTSGYLNLAAGTLTLGTPMANGNTGAGSTGASYLNFAGGTIQTNAAVTSILPATAATQTITSTIFGAINNFAATGNTSQNFTGGLTVDTNTFNSSITTPLLGATGTGVTQADITIVSGGTGYIGAPMVKFSTAGVVAGGTPAAGYAIITGGAVTGIVITDPGTYTSGTVPTITLIGGGASAAANVTVPGSTALGLVTNNLADGGLTKIGTGTLTLSSTTSSYTGNINITGGTLTTGAGPNLTNATTGPLGNPQTVGRTITVGNGTTLNFSGNDVLGNSGSTVVAKIIVNGGTVTNGTTNYTTLGPVDLNGGTITSTGGASTSFESFQLGGTITIGGSTVSTISGSGSNSGMQLGSAYTTGTSTTFNVADVTNSPASDLDVSVVLQNSGTTNGNTNGLIKTGLGTMTLSGANTYKGATTVSNGTLAISGTGSLYGANTNTATVSVAAGSQIILSGAATNNALGFGPSAIWNVSGTINSTGGSAQTLPGTVTLTNGTLTGIASTGSNATFGTFFQGGTNATITANGASNTISADNIGMSAGSTLTLATPLATDALSVSSALGVTGNVAGGLKKTGAGTVTLSGLNNFTGGTTINAGTLQLGSTGALNSTGGSENAVTFGASSTGTLALAGNSVVVANLSTNATPGTTFVQNANGANAANATLTVGNATNASGLYAGTIQDGTGGTGTLALTKAGAGTLTLTGTNSYTGGTTISGGTLAVSSDLNLGGTAGGVTVGAGTLRGTATFSTARQVTLTNAASAVLVDAAAIMTITGKVTGAGTLNVSGPGTLTLGGTAANDYAGGTTVTGGTLLANNTVNSTGSGPVTVQSGAILGGGGFVAAVTTMGIGSTLAPSAGSAAPLSTPLTLTGGVSFADATATYVVTLVAPTLGSYDRVVVGTGTTATLNGASLVINDASYIASAQVNDQFWIVDGATGSLQVAGTFGSISGSSGATYKLDYNLPLDPLGTGNDVRLTVTSVPEPAMLSFLGLSAMALTSRRRRRVNGQVKRRTLQA